MDAEGVGAGAGSGSANLVMDAAMTSIGDHLSLRPKSRFTYNRVMVGFKNANFHTEDAVASYLFRQAMVLRRKYIYDHTRESDLRRFEMVTKDETKNSRAEHRLNPELWRSIGFDMVDGVFQLSSSVRTNFHFTHPFHVNSFKAFASDLALMNKIATHAKANTVAHNHLQMLSKRFELYTVMNRNSEERQMVHSCLRLPHFFTVHNWTFEVEVMGF